MFVILSYDVGSKRVARVRKVCAKYLRARHRSVFGGELSVTRLRKLESELERIVDPASDSVFVWRVESVREVTTDALGLTPRHGAVI